MLSIAIIALLLVGATGFALASIRALADPDRAHDMPSRRHFLAEFEGGDVPANVLVEAYEAIGRRLSGKERLTRATRLANELGLTPADVEDIALLVAARCEGRLPTAADLNHLDRSVDTVGELISFLRPFCVHAEVGRSHLALLA